MNKLIKAVFVILGIWAGAEVATQGPDRAFNGALASVMESGASTMEGEEPARSTARRAGDATERARDKAEARRERMLGE